MKQAHAQAVWKATIVLEMGKQFCAMRTQPRPHNEGLRVIAFASLATSMSWRFKLMALKAAFAHRAPARATSQISETESAH